MVLRRIGVWSAAKLNGVLYACIGLLIGIVVSLASMLGAMAGSQLSAASDFGGFGIPAMFIGVGAIILFPLLYGVLGMIGGAVGAGVYNLAAGVMGGLEMEFETGSGAKAG